MTPMQRDDTREDEGRADRGRVHERCLCTGRISDVQNNNKDTLCSSSSFFSLSRKP